MEWLDRLNRAIRYIEDNLEGDLNALVVAAQANSSPFHFQRMFTILTGVSLAEYIRRRRLTLAAGEIQQGREILDTALKYGYESQASFSRAFSRIHGMPPGSTRDSGSRLKAYPPMTFNLTIQGVQSMDYEIRNVKEFKLAGDIREFTSRDGQNYVEIPKFWNEMHQNNRVKSLQMMADKSGLLKGGMVGACLDFSKDQEEFNYLIAVEPSQDADVQELTIRFIPEGKWAIFPGKGLMPEAIQTVWKRIFSEWFPATDYTHSDGPELEIYLPMEEGSSDTVFEIWIPIE